MSPPPDLDELTPPQLKKLVVRLLNEVAELKQTVAQQREEIARLKGLKGRPEIKPSGVENATAPAGPKVAGNKPRRGKVRPRVSVEDRDERVSEQQRPGTRLGIQADRPWAFKISGCTLFHTLAFFKKYSNN